MAIIKLAVVSIIINSSYVLIITTPFHKTRKQVGNALPVAWVNILYATLKYLSILLTGGESLNAYEKLQDEASSDGVEVISYPFRTD